MMAQFRLTNAAWQLGEGLQVNPKSRVATLKPVVCIQAGG
jgi:hypothetical protein